jgi:acetate kinase
MTPVVLAINTGSSSIKFGLFECAERSLPVVIAKGAIEDTRADPRLTLRDASGSTDETVDVTGISFDRERLFAALLEVIDKWSGGRPLAAVGHRVVHGGSDFGAPVIVDVGVLAAIDRLTPMAPLHQPRCLEPIRAICALRPELTQVACFDTAFHQSLKPPVSRYAIPRALEVQGIRKYGFHGLSYEFVAGCLGEISPELAAGRTVVAHLGNGASLCAMRGGESVDTTMGFSALDGLVMGTRCGALDPGVILYLQEAYGLGPEELADILYHRSGLLGVSEISSDMRDLLASSDRRAREATELFAFRASQSVAMMAHALGGLDTLVFTGGIGEHVSEIRAAICERLQWLGVELDPERNDGSVQNIGRSEGRVAILIVPTNEEIVIARHVSKTIMWGARDESAGDGHGHGMRSMPETPRSS